MGSRIFSAETNTVVNGERCKMSKKQWANALYSLHLLSDIRWILATQKNDKRNYEHIVNSSWLNSSGIYSECIWPLAVTSAVSDFKECDKVRSEKTKVHRRQSSN
jgi:hypothetical protein